MNFFKLSNLRKTDGFSDEEIDRFVQHLRDNRLTIENEAEAMNILNIQPNIDPSLAENSIIDEKLNISPGMPLYSLWKEFPEIHYSDFSPMEYMKPAIANAHDVMIENFKKSNQPGTCPKFDDNQAEIYDFITELNDYSYKLLKNIEKEHVAAGKDINSSMSEIMDMFENDDDNMAALGGFKDKEELQKAMESFMSDALKDIDENDDELISAPKDAEIIMRLSKNRVRAWIFIIPPRNGGNEISEKQINDFLAANNVVYGIDKFMIKKIKQKKLYFKMIEIAKGTDPINGSNGRVEELFSRKSNVVDIKEDEHGNVDYKSMNIIKSIHKGDVIANIILPTPATTGIGVDGHVARGVDGVYPKVPAGRNTRITEDRTKLISEIDGEIFFENDKFNVRNVLVIKRNIDSSIGNIDFAGDIDIYGNVREGFTVCAEGDIRIMGHAEGAVIKSGGSISITNGITGGTSGKLEAKGNIRCKFIERCLVVAGGYVEADQILLSTVSGDTYVKASGENGKIVGGAIYAGESISAKHIGNESNSSAVTKITVGKTYTLLNEEINLTEKLKEIDENIKKLNQNIIYIKSQRNPAMNYSAILKKLEFQLNVRNMQKTGVNASLKRIREKSFDDNGKNEINCKILNPPVVINFCGNSYRVTHQINNCRVVKQTDGSYVYGSNLKNAVRISSTI